MTDKLSPMASLQMALAGLIAGADPSHVGLMRLYQELLDWTDSIKTSTDALQKKANFLEALRIAGVDNWQGYSQAYEVAEEYGLDIGDD